ncbi:MAG: trypsin-like peptidase domain-containing protein [Bacteroidota bacterium]|nr:trypsin-like peptidase domain-containing protein [Bacteroidota bacterium]
MKKIILLITAFLGFASMLRAQISEGGTPLSFGQKIASQLNSDFPEEILPFVNVATLLAEDAVEEQYKNIPFRFAYPHQVNFTTANSGKWDVLSNGSKIWRLKITSTGAYSLNLTFDEYNLPIGAKLFIYNQEKSQVIGAFTHNNNKPYNQLGTVPVEGESIIVEYYEPIGTPRSNAFKIGTVAHDYKNIFKQAVNFNNSGSCNNNVICPLSAGWEEQIRSVALITTNGGSRLCTGSLVNNTCNNGTPYFLTADHCLGSGVNTWVFIFNYDSPQCSPSIDGPLANSISGCSLRANNPGSDFALLELSSVPPASYDVFYAGWDRTGDIPTFQTAIHHPSGDVKKISFDYDPASAVTWNGAACWEIANWESGTTEPGSSGSPLFDNNNRLIGQLYGGSASCSSITDDAYGRFDVSWNGSSASNRLSDWLDPCNTNDMTIDGFNPNQPTLTLDAGISSILSPLNGASSCDLFVNPSIMLRNYGIDTLTQVTINYREVSNSPNIFNWTGSLASNQTTLINLPVMNFTNPGSYTLEVYTSNPNGGTDANNLNDTLRRNFNIITVNPIPLDLIQGFDGVTFPPSGWTIGNPDNQEVWKRTTTANGFGNSAASAMFNNFDDDNTGQKDYIITPFLDFSQAVTPITLNFNIAYARYSNSYYDSLEVVVSLDCGNTWQRVFAKGNTNLSTTGTNSTNSFTPTSSQWRAESINLDAFQSEQQVQIAFVNISGYGNNLYLDDINLYGSSLFLESGFTANDSVVCTGNCIDFTDLSTGTPSNWQWSFPGASTSSSTDQNPTGICYPTAGNYDVTLIVSNGNTADTLVKSNYISVINPPTGSSCGVNINEHANNIELKLFPNPTDGQISITYDLPIKDLLSVKVWNVLGSLILDSNAPLAKQGSLIIDLSGRTPGMYFIEINAGAYKKVEKVMLR